jgi:hypothetical protein
VRRALRLWVGLVVGVVVAAAPLVHPATANASAPPYTDPNAQGSIGLCDQAGHPVTSGRVDQTPFVWAAVSTQAPAKGYGGDGRTAALFLYQPRRGVDPGEWSGQLMTSSSTYTNPAHPMTVATGGDSSLADYLSTFPASWDGYLQLRLFLGAPGQSQYTQHYPTTDIQVTGKTWQVVRGGGGPCGSGSAQSFESQVLPSNLLNPTTTTTAAPSSNAATGPLGTNPGNVVGKGSTGETVHTAQASATEPSKATSNATGLAIAIAAVAVALVGVGSWLLFRHRSRAPVESPTSEEP